MNFAQAYKDYSSPASDWPEGLPHYTLPPERAEEIHRKIVELFQRRPDGPSDGPKTVLKAKNGWRA